MNHRTRISSERVVESSDFLLKTMKSQTDALLRSRVHALYLLKSGEAVNFTQIGIILGFGRLAIRGWFSTYSSSGLNGLLTRQPSGKGRTSQIDIKLGEEGLNKLIKWLSAPENCPNSYKEVHQWMIKDYGITLDYKTVHSYLKQKLKATLKVPRKSNVKKDPAKVEEFKKNYLNG